jgi:hypothetical protein
MKMTTGTTGDFDCARARPWLGPPGSSALGEDETTERRVRDHLASCSACRDLASADDPAVLFLELRGGPLPPAIWAGFREELRARVAKRRLDWLAPLRYPALAYVTAPLVTLLVLGAALVTVRPGLVPWRRPEAARSPYVLPAGPASQARPAPRAGVAPSGALPPAGRGPASGDALEEVGSPGARVYRFTVGAPGDETPIYFVVDDSINI